MPRAGGSPTNQSGSVLIYTVAIMGIVVLVGLAVFLWKQLGPGSGRRFGNRVAAHVGIPRSLFYSLLVHGIKGSHLDLLASLKKSNMGLDQASAELGPPLARGIERLEARFGQQDSVDVAKPIVAKLVAALEQKP